MIRYKKHHFAAFLTDLGGATSHTAIVAKSLNIPAVVALHNARQLIRENEWLIVDGAHGVVIVNPDKPVLAEYRLQAGGVRPRAAEAQAPEDEAGDDARRAVDVELHANIELPGDVARRARRGASGVGLFRSEFLFLNRRGLPSRGRAVRGVPGGRDGPGRACR